MVVIHGECRSGKTAKALSLLNKKRKSMYFVLDSDKSILKLKTTIAQLLEHED